MKNRLMRPAAALFPIALLAAYHFGQDFIVAELLMFYFAMQLLSLCAVDSFRNAAAREPGRRRVDKRFWGSLPMLVLSGAACTALAIWINDNYSYELIAAAWLIIIEQLFEERLYTLNHRADGNLLSLISNGLLFTGLMLDSTKGLPMPFYLHGFYTLCAAGLGMVIAVLVSLVAAPPKGFSLIPRNLGFAPKAILQQLLYPALIFWLSSTNIDYRADHPIYEFRLDFAMIVLEGLILWRLCRTVCRRSADESRPLNLLLAAVSAALAVAGYWYSDLMAASALCCMVFICAIILYLRPSWRNIGAAVLLIAAFVIVSSFDLPQNYKMYAVIACSLIAVVINLKHSFLKKV